MGKTMDIYSQQASGSSQLTLTPYIKFLSRWGWYIVLSILVTTVSTLLIPDIITPPVYQATLSVQVPLPEGMGGDIHFNNSTTFYSTLFISPSVLNTVLPKHEGLQLSDLQALVTAVPVTNTDTLQLSALGFSPHDATSLVNDVYDAVVKELHMRRSKVVTDLTVALTAELKQSQADVNASSATLQNLTLEHRETTFEYLEAYSLYQEQLKRVQSIHQILLSTQDQGFGREDILRVGSTTPNITTVPVPQAVKDQRLALSPLIGLIMGLGGALLASTFSNRLPLRGKRRETVLPRVVATIPVLPKIREKYPQTLKGLAPCLPLLRHLRYQASEHERRLQLVTVTSPREQEGKSTVATGLAIAAAQSGLRTLLVDANPQRPVLHMWFQFPNMPGTLDTVRALSTGAMSPSPIRGTFETNLGMIPIGSDKQSSDVFSEALRIDGLRPFVESLRGQADMVVFDGPPLLSDANAINLIEYSDITLLVVDAQKSQTTAVVEAEHLLASIGMSYATVLNRAKSEAVE